MVMIKYNWTYFKDKQPKVGTQVVVKCSYGQLFANLQIQSPIFIKRSGTCYRKGIYKGKTRLIKEYVFKISGKQTYMCNGTSRWREDICPE